MGLRNKVLIGSTVSLIALSMFGCNGKFYSGDINDNGIKDFLKAKTEGESFHISLVEGKEEDILFFANGKTVSNLEVTDLDGNELEDIVFAFQGREQRNLFNIMNYSNSGKVEPFEVNEMERLPNGDKKIKLKIKELANNTPLVIADNEVYHLENKIWERYNLTGKFLKKDFDMNKDGIGDFVLLRDKFALNFMISDNEGHYHPTVVESDKEIRDLDIEEDSNIVVHKLLGSHSRSTTTMVMGGDGKLKPGIKTVKVYEMMADSYLFDGAKFDFTGSEEYETQSGGSMGMSFSGGIGIAL